jgi:hypothetical protein
MRFVARAGACFILALTCGAAGGCGTDAVGVSQCRTLEQARCKAGAACGLVDDIDACIRFSRDHCLHGTATGTSPKAADVRDCAAVLDDAGSCAKDSKKTSAQRCGIDLVSGTGSATVCDVIAEPEKALLCSFLQPEAPAPVHHVTTPDASTSPSADGG